MNASKTAPALRSRWSSNRPEDRFTVDNPATGEPLAEVHGAGVAEVDAAVRCAHAAYQNGWRQRAPMERGKLLIAVAELLDKHAEDLARLESQENGKPVTQARGDVNTLITTFRYFGGMATAVQGQLQDSGFALSLTMLEPHGVVAGIIPFNWPPIHTGNKAAPALAVGNAVLLKPGEQAPLTIMRIVDIANEVLPPDLLHAVPGGADTGRALVVHPLVNKVSFTGSTAAGAAVLGAIAPQVKPAMMELGGKNALLILDDADLEHAVECAVDGAFFNQGEACTASSRILVHRSLHDRFVERFCKHVQRLVVGDPAHPATAVGPLVTRVHQQRVLEYIEIGQREGAHIAARAALPTDARWAGGFWVAPTVFTGVTPQMRIANEEIFGPVAMVMPFDDEQEATAIANDTPYGLVAGVVSNNITRAMGVGRQLTCGIVFINNYSRMNLHGTPFGGAKHSGFGRELAVESLREFGYSKSLRMPSGVGEMPLWPPARRQA